MSLRDKLKAKKSPESVLTIDGDRYKVVGLARSVRSKHFAECRGKDGKVDSARLEGTLLSVCVSDPDSGQPVFTQDEWKEWDSVPSAITGPLFAEVMKLNGMDNEDVGREVKNSDTTAS